MSDDKPKADYVIGNKKPPPGRPFQKGKSGNPSGRPKNLSRFGDVLMKEFFKPVVAQVGGKMVRASQSQLLAQQMVKNGITKGPQAKSGSGEVKVSKTTPPSYLSHPQMPLPGTAFVMYGGSCSKPVVKDADVYIGFEGGMKFTGAAYPWNKGEEILFRVVDMGVPENPIEYDRMVCWTAKQIEAGAKVHAGCIGGHGRTGMFLSAVVSKFGEKDAIAYVRAHYCKRAVESTKQVEFLGKYFGITPVDGYKSNTLPKGSTKKSATLSVTSTTPKGGAGVTMFTPVGGQGLIWG